MSVKCMRNNLMKKFFNMVLSVMIVLLIFPYNTAAETRKEKALAAYQNFLGKYESSFTVLEGDFEKQNKEDYKYCSEFIIKDMNGDKVPELVTLHPVGYKNAEVYIYTYKKGKVSRVNKKAISCTCISGGTAYVYFCSKKHLHNHYLYGLMGESDTAYALKSNGKLSKYLEYQESYITNKISCKKNEKNISVKKYNSLARKCVEQQTIWKENNLEVRRKIMD